MYMLKKTLHRGWSLLLDILFAPACLLCQNSTDHPHHLCPECLNKLPKRPENHCLRCGNWTVAVQTGCGQCLENRGTTADATYFAYRYEGCMTDLIVGLKFTDHPEWSILLGRLFWQQLQAELNWESPDMVIPIPLHPRRLITRRYNQSALLAHTLTQFLHRPLVTNGLKRIKMTQSQTHLNAQKRIENMRGAFRAEKKRVQDRAVLLVDDVFTTGATTRAAVRALKRAGARRVAVACLASTQPGQHTAKKETRKSTTFQHKEPIMAEVILYTTNVCPFCTRAKMLLNKRKANYQEINLTLNPEQREEMIQKAGGQRTVPQIFINGRHIGGCDELYELELDDELETLLAS